MNKKALVRVPTQKIRNRQGRAKGVVDEGLWERATTAADGARHVALDKPKAASCGVAKSDRLFDNRVENGLEVSGRGVDDLQHLRDRRLLLPGLGEFALARGKRREQGVTGRLLRLRAGGLRRGRRRRRGASGSHQAGIHD